MSSSDDGGYVHDPSRFGPEGERLGADDASEHTDRRDGVDGESETDSADWITNPLHPDAVDREFDWRGWVLVGVMLFAFVLAPLGIFMYPPEASGYLFALIILPLFPAIALAVTAVWATTRP